MSSRVTGTTARTRPLGATATPDPPMPYCNVPPGATVTLPPHPLAMVPLKVAELYEPHPEYTAMEAGMEYSASSYLVKGIP